MAAPNKGLQAMQKPAEKSSPAPRAGIHNLVVRTKRFVRKLAQGATAAIEIGLLLAPAPGGKIHGAAKLARGLTFLGFGRMWRGVAIAIGAPILAGHAAEKLGDDVN